MPTHEDDQDDIEIEEGDEAEGEDGGDEGPEPIERLEALMEEFKNHQQRIAEIPDEELDAVALRGELVETFMPLVVDMVEALADGVVDVEEQALEDTNDIEERLQELVTVVSEGAAPALPLGPADAQEIAALLGAFRITLGSIVAADATPEQQAELGAVIARTDAALERVAEAAAAVVEPEAEAPAPAEPVAEA